MVTFAGDTCICSACGSGGVTDTRPELPLIRHQLMTADVQVRHGLRFYCPRDARARTLLELFLLRSGEIRGGRLVAHGTPELPRRR